MQPTYWMLVSGANNFETSRARGFDIAGMKSRHGKKAAEVRPGDKVIFYLTGVMAFGGTAEVTGEAFYAEDPIWCSSKAGEAYPHRFPIRMEVAAEPNEYVPAAELVEPMSHTKKWPAQHWRLAFQGNVHRLPAEDYELIRQAIEQRAGVLAR
ncbi:MAG: EVE domain-containing protein [Chloroflexota bacterium]|nr:EVE domain-containing protein [Chloroflexota bacterium]